MRHEIAQTGTPQAPGVGPAMWIDPRYQALLDQSGLAEFANVMDTKQGRLLRSLPDRENWRLDLPYNGGRPRGMYLKKHHVRTPGTWLRARLGIGPGATPGGTEARNVRLLEQAGVAVMRLVAFGQALATDGLAESFVLTEELAGYLQLDQFLIRRFPPVAGGQQKDSELAVLVRAIADLAARLHRAGFNHRDLYTCHIFVREEPAGRFSLRLIDLQRVERRRWFRGRWLVKDLAQLAYSACPMRITRTLRLAFVKRYLGVTRLRDRDKRLIRRVLARERAMRRRLGAYA